jgi:hypothetical protein
MHQPIRPGALGGDGDEREGTEDAATGNQRDNKVRLGSQPLEGVSVAHRLGWQLVQAPKDNVLLAEKSPHRPWEILARDGPRRQLGPGDLPRVCHLQRLPIPGKLDEHETIQPEELPELLE